MHHRQLLGIKAVEGCEGIESVLVRRLAGGVVVVMVMMMVLLEERREILPFRPALVSSGLLVPR